MRRIVWWQPVVLALALLALFLPLAARATAGAPSARVHVRWQTSTDQAARQEFEVRFRLTEPERLDESTWRYTLTDHSSGNIQALVNEPAVADTHDLDRSNYTVDSGAVRVARRQRFQAGGDALVMAADVLGITLGAVAGLLLLIGISGRAPTPRSVPALLANTAAYLATRARVAAFPVARFLQRGIPEVSAVTAGAFRIVFGFAVLAFFASHQFDASTLERTFDVKVGGELHVAVLNWLRGRPYIVNALTPWLLTMGVAFTIGIFTRLTYGLFVAGAIVWAYVAVYVDSTLMITLVALLPSRWGDALSVDMWLRRARGGEHDSRPVGKVYGYSTWVPGLVFGVAFAAAAWAKLSNDSGWTSWIMNGAIKYHFATDAGGAPVDWGLQFINYPLLAILASFLAVATETLVITAAFCRSQGYRLTLGAAALSLLVGFRVLMGVFWVGWWILLLGFLPWQRLSGLTAPAGRHAPGTWRASGAQLAVVVMVVAQQVVISTLTIERAPMFTPYPMYSATWASLEAFNASRPPVYRIVASTDRGSVELPCNPSEALVTEFREAVDGSAEAAASVWSQLRGCDNAAVDANEIVFEGYWKRFDRRQLAFTSTPAAMTLGPLVAGPARIGSTP